MNNKVVGIFLIIMGVALIVWGYDMFDSVESQASRAMGGSAPISAWVGMICGAMNIIVGVTKLK